MKKETIFFAAIALAVGVLIGVIYSNQKKDTPQTSSTSLPPLQAPVNHQQQITMLEGIVAREPDNRNAWIQLGHNYFDANEPMPAIDAYAKALALDPDDPDILTDQGVMYRRVGWYDKAIVNFQKAYQLNNRHQQSLYNLGIVYRYDLQDFDKAMDAWNRFIALNPSGPGAEKVRAELDFLKNHPQLPQPSQPLPSPN
ncbi:MAG: tetratricopeptide repeat protein [Desulfuromonadales bacterium]|nr:tetratricopeptide repeat protein [Desulfuromonadales bacterium]MBN2791258.1 tetratricopeptide repeat protein [Desulfuromonadales bacterium]